MSEIIDTTVRSIKTNALTTYIYWHFMEMPVRLLNVWYNLIFLALHRFSVGMHLRTLLSPFRKYRFTGDKSKIKISDMLLEWVSALVMNIFSRLMGIIFRLTLIMIGTLNAAIMFVIGGIVFVSWFVLPVIAVVLILNGITLIA